MGSLELRFVVPHEAFANHDGGVAWVQLCRGGECFTIDKAYTFDSRKLTSPEGDTYGLFSLPEGEYQEARVLLRTPGGFKLSRIPLSQPLTVSSRGRQAMFFTLGALPSGRVTNASTLSAFPPASIRVFAADPRSDAPVQLTNGFKLNIRSKSLNQPQIFTLSENDTGSSADLYSVYPSSTLLGPAKVTIPVSPDRNPEGFNGKRVVKVYYQDQTTDETRVVQQSVTGSTSANSIEIETSQLGQIKVENVQRSFVDGNGHSQVLPDSATSTAQGTLAPLATSSQQCADRLQTNLTTIKNTIASSGSVYTDLCLNISPSVHIVVVDMTKPSYQTEIEFYTRQLSSPDSILNTAYVWNLDTVYNHTTGYNAFVGINGATFRGGYCSTCGSEYPHFGVKEFKGTSNEINPYGLPSTTVIGQNNKLADVSGYAATKKPESVLVFYKNANSSGIRGKQIAAAAGSVFPTSDSGGPFYTAVGSTTSIIRNGACNLTAGAFGSTINTSSIGFGNNRLVFVSSDHNAPIDPFLLCGIYEGLNTLDGAILLDGGAAAQLVYPVGGAAKLLNPPNLKESTVFDPAQKISYSFAIEKTAR